MCFCMSLQLESEHDVNNSTYIENEKYLFDANIEYALADSSYCGGSDSGSTILVIVEKGNYEKGFTLVLNYYIGSENFNKVLYDGSDVILPADSEPLMALLKQFKEQHKDEEQLQKDIDQFIQCLCS